MSIFNKPQQKPMPTFSASQTVLPSAAISRIESGSLAELNVPNLMLKKGEKCCFVDKSYEMVETTTTRNIRKSGGTSMPSVFFKKHINFIPSLSLTPFYHTSLSNKHPTKHIYNTLLKQVQHQKTFPYKNNPALSKVRGHSNDFYSILNPVRHTAHPSPAHTTRWKSPSPVALTEFPFP